MIEQVAELEKAPKVHYLPHQAVVRKESATTKVRVVYDASSKENKNVACLNDCLHAGPPLTPYFTTFCFDSGKIEWSW